MTFIPIYNENEVIKYSRKGYAFYHENRVHDLIKVDVDTAIDLLPYQIVWAVKGASSDRDVIAFDN